MLRAEIKISGVEPRVLDALHAALTPESEPTPRHRSRVEVVRESPFILRITISSRDLSSLRASLNMVLRALGALCKSSEVISQARSACNNRL